LSEWTVITVLIAVVGLLVTVTAPVIKLMGTITRLSCSVEDLRGDIETLTSKNAQSHTRLWEHNKEQDLKISGHEGRIGTLEGRAKPC